jgi:GH15 family glucan-1,4-alpha-glucosidase
LIKTFIQSFESPEVLDSAVLIMPLVFFISPADERLISTIKQILKPPEKGGLTSNGLVFRCMTSDGVLILDNHLLAEDGVGGREGSFSMCTFWLVEALTRAGKYDKSFIAQAVLMFEDMITYSNHLGLYSEEITRSGEVCVYFFWLMQSLGNFPQAFTHMACISAAFNLDRVLP